MKRAGRPRGAATQAVRVLRVWALLAEWRTLDELAAESGVCVRTVRRDLHALGEVCPVAQRGKRFRRSDAEREKAARDEAVAAEREVCAGCAATVLAEVEGAAAKAPASFAAGEAAAARRIFGAITARGET